MNTFGRRLLFFALFVMLLVACSPARAAVAPLMEVPDEGRLLVLTLVTAGVTWLLLKASIVFKVDLSGHAGPVAVAVAPIFVTLIEAGLRLIPPVFDNIVLTIIHLIVLLVGSIGTFFLFQRKAPRLR